MTDNVINIWEEDTTPLQKLDKNKDDVTLSSSGEVISSAHEQDTIPYVTRKKDESPNVVPWTELEVSDDNVIDIWKETPQGESIQQGTDGVIAPIAERGGSIPKELSKVAQLESVLNALENTYPDDSFKDTLLDAASFAAKYGISKFETDVSIGTSILASPFALTSAALSLPADIYQTVKDREHKLGDLSSYMFAAVQGKLTYVPETERAQRWTEEILDQTFGRIHRFGEWAAENKFGTPEEFFKRTKYKEDGFMQQMDMHRVAALQALFKASPDLLLMALPIALTRGKAPSIPDFATQEARGFLSGKERIGNLQKLDGRIDPDNVSPKQQMDILAAMSDMREAELEPTITILKDTNGDNIKILGGAETLYAAEYMKGRGLNLRNIDVQYKYERAPLTEDEIFMAQHSLDSFKSLAHLEPREALRQAKSLAERVGIRETTNPGFVAERTLFKLTTPEAVRAIDLRNLQAGASKRGQMRFMDVRPKIYSGLYNFYSQHVRGMDGKPLKLQHKGKDITLKVREGLDLIISLKRDVTLRDAFNTLPVERRTSDIIEAAKKGDNSEALLKRLNLEMDPVQMADFEHRANAFFDALLDNAKRLREEGILSEKGFANVEFLHRFRIPFTKEILDRKLSPEEDPVGIFKDTSQDGSSTESGIRESTGESLIKFGEDSELLLIDSIYRTEARIARNNANKALADTIRKNPEEASLFARIAIKYRDKNGSHFQKPKKDERVIQFMDDGEVKKIYMNKVFADSWNRVGHENLSQMLNILRMISGTKLIKLFATGINPAFAPISLAMDISHTYIASSNVYSKVPPIYFGEIGMDLIQTARDAFTRTGSYRDFVWDGGAPHFRTNQGYMPEGLLEAQLLQKVVNPRVNVAIQTLAYPSETAEIWVRLAIRNRVLRNQRKAGLPEDGIHASAIARSMMDYSKSGRLVRILDSVIPYFSASTVAANAAFAPAARTGVRTGIDGVRIRTPLHSSDAAEWATGIMWNIGAAFSWELFNLIRNREEHEHVNFDDRARYMVLHTGMSREDDYGSRRFLFIKLKEDPTVVPFKAIGINLAHQFMYPSKEGIPQSQWEYMKAALPINISDAFPLSRALSEYVNDENLWSGDAIWGGRAGISPSLEVRRNVHPLIKMIAETGGLSPARLQRFWDAIIPDNSVLKVADVGFYALKKIIEDDEDVRNIWNMRGQEFWNNFPIARRVLSETHPYSNAALRQKLETYQEADKLQALDNRMTEIIDQRDLYGQNNKDAFQQVLQEAVTTIGPQAERRLRRRYIMSGILRKVYQHHTALIRDTSTAWWINTANLEPGPRAEEFYRRWKDTDKAERGNMESLVGAFDAVNVGFGSKDFWITLNRLKKERGTEYVIPRIKFEEGMKQFRDLKP